MSNEKNNWYPEVGDKFTISANKVVRDRSYTDKIWTCACVNNLCVAFEHPDYGLKLLIKSEHDFAPMKDCPAKEKKEKWEPKDYAFFLYGDGRIVEGTAWSNSARKRGSLFKTQEAAEIARNMNKRNQLILQAKLEKGYGDGRWSLEINEDGRWWANIAISRGNPELTFETKEQAEDVLKMVGPNGHD